MRLYILIKSKKMPIGTVSKGRKKIAEGNWRKLPKGRTASAHAYEVEAKNARKAIMDITKNKYEHAVAIASDGTRILSKKGTAHTVNFTEAEINDIRGARLVIHNHPNNNTFTPIDLLFAIQLGITEIQVVANNKVYSYTPDYGKIYQSGMDLEGIDNDLIHRGSDIYKPLWVKMGIGDIDKAMADSMLCDGLMNYFVKTYGGKYAIKQSKNQAV